MYSLISGIRLEAALLQLRRPFEGLGLHVLSMRWFKERALRGRRAMPSFFHLVVFSLARMLLSLTEFFDERFGGLAGWGREGVSGTSEEYPSCLLVVGQGGIRVCCLMLNCSFPCLFCCKVFPLDVWVWSYHVSSSSALPIKPLVFPFRGWRSVTHRKYSVNTPELIPAPPAPFRPFYNTFMSLRSSGYIAVRTHAVIILHMKMLLSTCVSSVCRGCLLLDLDAGSCVT